MLLALPLQILLDVLLVKIEVLTFAFLILTFVVYYIFYEELENLKRKIYLKFKKIEPVLTLSLGQKFVLASVIFLVMTACVLAFMNEFEANILAILAYYLLVLGVFNLVLEYFMESKVNFHTELRAAVSLAVLSLMIHFTFDISIVFPYLYLLPIVLGFLILYPEIIKLLRE